MATNRSVPGNFNYNNIEKKDKNFMYKNLERSNCYNCDFSGSIFDFVSFRGAHFKSTNFYRCSFTYAEFIGTNLKDSDFKSAVIENAVFDSVKLEGANFKDAKFINTIFLSTDISKAKNLDTNTPGIRIFEEMPKLEISEELRTAVLTAMENKYVKKARVLDTKDGGLNTLNIMLLLENFTEETIIEGLKLIVEKIDREFYTLSYIIKFLKSM
ncbi:pentapeptide repeat-containing protein [Clostridium swellfunianum]|uniref:pentapeptide repeat-containing protein n=1 Tax=Clostridium swellfunianum TaxID=1367462 RepID=UPI00202F7649|nr:pentapeptide repeat-containing protein [Clostridium swellfunianum]MCM0648085.1 pentapeptide repeat-containing protein [Clostridium swellfunianum]